MGAILLLLLQLFSFALFARAILSWFSIRPSSGLYPIVDVLRRVTEPVLAPLRRIIPPIGGFDVSFLVAIIAINAIGIPLASAL